MLTTPNQTVIVQPLTLFLLRDLFSRLREDMGFCFGTEVGVHPDLLAASNYRNSEACLTAVKISTCCPVLIESTVLA